MLEKERELGGIQEGMQRIELGMGSKFEKLEETIIKLSGYMIPNMGSPSMFTKDIQSRPKKDTNEYNKPFSLKLTKLEFPKFSNCLSTCGT